MLIDVSSCCPHHTNSAVDELFEKSFSGDGNDSIWRPHESPYIRKLIELFTARGLQRFKSLQEELAKWMTGKVQHEGGAGRIRPDTNSNLRRWSENEMALVRLYLYSVPVGDLRNEDWLMLVDYLVQKYLPEEDLIAEAEWLAYRSSIMGMVQRQAPDLSEEKCEAALAAAPATAAEAEKVFRLSPTMIALLDYGKSHCAEAVVGLSSAARHAMRSTIIDWHYAKMTNDKQVQSDLQQRLMDQFATLNRDWRRIAVTEAGENANQAVVAATPKGGRLRRLEQYTGACPWCRSINGRVMEVVAPSAPKKDGATQIWPGKTNVGRSASPRKQTPDGLVDRTPDEMWWVAAGCQHPHCRGTWVPVEDDKIERAGDPDFTNWLNNALAGVV